MFVDKKGVFRQVRQQKMLSADEVSEQTKISKRQLLLYESGKRDISLTHLETLCSFYGIAVTTIVGKSVDVLVGEMNVGEKIAYYRKKTGLSQKQVADKIGKSDTLISDCENGYRTPPLVVLRMIADAINVPVEKIADCHVAPKEPFCNRFSTLKEERKVSNHKIAKETGVSERIISRCDAADYVPELYVIKRIADYFSVPVEELNDGMSLEATLEVMTMAERIRFARKMKGLSQQELAEMVKADKHTVVSYEQPNKLQYSKNTLNKITKALEITDF